MMRKLILGLIAVSSLWATTETLTLNNAGNTKDGSVNISPYSGTLVSGNGTTQVNLYCDDFNNESVVGSSWSVNVTTANGDLSTTRYDLSNPVGAGGITGPQLYEELAWLYTQLNANISNSSTAKAIQEAAWHLTSSSTSQPSNYNYSQWISNAAADYNQTVTGYVTPDYSQWYVLTQTGYAGNTSSSGNQEMLAQYSSGAVIPTTTTPEPGTLLLAGTALVLAGFSRRISRIRRGK